MAVNPAKAGSGVRVPPGEPDFFVFRFSLILRVAVNPAKAGPGLEPISGSQIFLMPFYVYILQSQTSGRYYCGQTSDLKRRLCQHNDPNYKLTKTTKRFSGPWELVWYEEHKSRSSAMKRERQIKKRGIKRFLEENAQSVESRGTRD